MGVAAHWYCLLLDSQRLRGIKDIERHLWREMGLIFGDDFEDVRLIGERLDEDAYELYSESYAFVKCRSYEHHAQRLKASSLIQLVLPSFHSPDIVSEDAIETFDRAARVKCGNNSPVSVGDIVLVRSGYLENLYGVVVREGKKDRFEVMFRLHTRHFIEEVSERNLSARGSVFRDHGVKVRVKAIGDAVDIRLLSPQVGKGARDSLENKARRTAWRQEKTVGKRELPATATL